MSNKKISALISILVTFFVLLASFFQWWDITINGGMITKVWVKILFCLLIIALLISAFLLLK